MDPTARAAVDAWLQGRIRALEERATRVRERASSGRHDTERQMEASKIQFRIGILRKELAELRECV